MISSVPSAKLTFDKVEKWFGGRDQTLVALDEVSFSVRTGDIHAVIGPSGAGKSTLFRCAATLEQPDRGRIVLDGVDLASLRGKELVRARQKLGAVFQQLHLFPSRTAAQNIALPLVLAGVARPRVVARVDELLGWVGLGGRSDSYPRELSGGQGQRVAIARALAAAPQLLLCDEPTSALDPETTETVLDLLRRVRDELELTVLIITHEMQVVRHICDRVTILDHGRVIEEGSVSQVVKHPRTFAARRLNTEAAS
jgi:D-methionine transport system ATP-binding protein